MFLQDFALGVRGVLVSSPPSCSGVEMFVGSHVVSDSNHAGVLASHEVFAFGRQLELESPG